MPLWVCVRQTSTKTFDARGRVSIKSTLIRFSARATLSLSFYIFARVAQRTDCTFFYCLSETHTLNLNYIYPLVAKVDSGVIESSHAKTHEVSCNNNSRLYQCSVAIRSPHTYLLHNVIVFNNIIL